MIDPLPINITRTSYHVYVRQAGTCGLSRECATLGEAREIAAYKAEALSLPIFHLAHDQNIKEQPDDGVYLAEERSVQVSVPVLKNPPLGDPS